MRLGPMLVGGGALAAAAGAALDLDGPDDGSVPSGGRLLETAGGGLAIAGIAMLARRPNAAVHDVVVGAGALRPHHVRARDLAALDTTTSTPGRWFHATSPTSSTSIVKSGVRISDGTAGAYGDGIYLTSRPDTHYGSTVIASSVQTRNPLVLHEDTLLDVAAFGRTVQPHIDAFAARHPRLAEQMEHSTLVRAALREAGHDAVVIERRRWDPTWLVALDDASVRLVTRET